ncbi:MAG: nucleotidyltransferase domain-containing protein [Fuerstiella sp.]
MTSQQISIQFCEGTRVILLRDITVAAGTVILRGTVAVVVASPVDGQSSHRIRFPNGCEHSVDASVLTTLVKFRDDATGLQDNQKNMHLFDSVIFQCVIGSRAYGLDHAESDVDRRGFFLPSADRHWSLKPVPEQITCDDTQEQYWEIQKFITLALKANPNVLECLFSPLIERTTPLVDELISIRNIFLSKLIYQTYNGYVMSQFKKMQAGMHKHGEAKPKHVMHMIRLLLSGIDTLRTGTLNVRVESQKDGLLAIRNGLMPWIEFDAWRQHLHKEFEQAFQDTRLPEHPNHEAANAFLVKARRSAVQESGAN